jgi:hypothetical protein
MTATGGSCAESEVGTSRGVRLFQDCRVLGTLREANGAALRRANYLLGYAKRFKISQEFILAAVASRVKIHVARLFASWTRKPPGISTTFQGGGKERMARMGKVISVPSI